MKNELDDFLIGPQGDEEDPFEEDLEPLEEEDEEDPDDPDGYVASGKECAVCGTQFTEEHGKPTVCKDCSGSEQGQKFPVATFPEVG